MEVDVEEGKKRREGEWTEGERKERETERGREGGGG